MKDVFKIGNQKIHSFIVKEEDVAAFDSETVHSVCSTFSLAREIEWGSRLFVLEMKEPDEEGIGTMLAIDHKSPALVGQKLVIVATVGSIKNNELICDIRVIAGERIVATAKTGQKILKRNKIEQLFTSVR